MTKFCGKRRPTANVYCLEWKSEKWLTFEGSVLVFCTWTNVHIYTHTHTCTWHSLQARRDMFVMLWADEPTPPATEAPDGKCSSDEFMCGDGTCIPLSQRCDRREYHCLDGTDELDCRTLSLLLSSLAVFCNNVYSVYVLYRLALYKKVKVVPYLIQEEALIPNCRQSTDWVLKPAV